MLWKVVDRACLILGAVFGGICAWYAMAAYYHWDVPTKPTIGPSFGAAMSPPWWFYTFGALGTALLVTGWMMMIIRHREARHQSMSAPVIGLSEDIPDLRVADSDLAIALFESKERDKLLPLLEGGKLSSWARPMRGNKPGEDPPPVILKGDDWRTLYFQHFPKAEGQFRAQTFLKTKNRHETRYFDVLFNRAQIERIWPEQISLAKAATRIYEAAEAEGVLDFVVSERGSADKKLTHLKLLLMVDEAIELFGVRPPSTKARLIAKTELTDELYPAEDGADQINHHISDDPVYFNVTVSLATLIPAISRYIAEAKGIAK
jgi:hypothetical protein